MKFVVTGASGFVGTALSRFLLEQGHTVTGLGTSQDSGLAPDAGFTWVRADTTRTGAWQETVADADVVVNLAGRTIFKRWTRDYKTRIVDSRLKTTRHLVSAMAGESSFLLSTSAVGYYGSRGEERLDEQAGPGDDFLARLSVDWEAAALAAQQKGARVAIMRFGVVLGAGGGALAQMVPAFRSFVGGPLGSGRQWFSWIHLVDLLGAVRFLIENEKSQGVYNFCAPGVIRQKTFAKSLGKILGRPALVPAPSIALRMMMGEMADMLLASQRVVPQRLIAEGFTFQFPDVDGALADLLKASP